jgi:hypothetical protein
MKSILLSLMLLTLPLVYSEGTASSLDTINSSHAWFKPSLTVNNSSVCKPFYDDGLDKYFSQTDLKRFYFFNENSVAGMEPVEIYKIKEKELSWEIDKVSGKRTSNSRGIRYITAYGKKLYIEEYVHSGCGGACERYQILVSEKIFPFTKYGESDFYSPLVNKAPKETPSYKLYKTSDQSYFLLTQLDQQIDLFKLSSNGVWETACGIDFSPPDLRKSTNHDVITVLSLFNNLKASISSIRQDYGYSCGSSRAHRRGSNYMRKNLLRTLYRPWAHYRSTPSYITLLSELERWSSIGISEYRAFLELKKEREKAEIGLARFYEKGYNWTSEYSRDMARRALSRAIASGFYFYMPNFPSDSDLRVAILEKQDIEAIRNSDMPFVDQAPAPYSGISGDSILNIAIEYPEALEYLLQKGADANRANAFGKTPLMYAAQHNQIEAAKLLLKIGANPNAATTWPNDTCYYNLQRSKMTPLHYAVRYASPDFIKLLLKSGARPLLKTEHKDKSKNSYPIDWLNKYTIDSADRNYNIDISDLVSLRKLLEVPSEDEL